MAAPTQPWDRTLRRFGSSHERTTTVGEMVREHSDQATRVWLYSSVFWLTIVDLFGLVLALELISPNLFGGIPWLLFGRIRPLHVNGVIFAWLTMMYWGALFYMVPRLTVGCILLAIGALTVATGGSLTRLGHQEYLYVAMSAGVGLMFWGYWLTIQPAVQSPASNRELAIQVAEQLADPSTP